MTERRPTKAQAEILERIKGGCRLIDVGSLRPKFYRCRTKQHEPDPINPVDAQSVQDAGWVYRGFLTTSGRAALAALGADGAEGERG